MQTLLQTVKNKFIISVLSIIALMAVSSNTIVAQRLHSADGASQPFKFRVGVNSSGYKYAETVSTDPVKYIELDIEEEMEDVVIIGDFTLAKTPPCITFSLSFIDLGVYDNRIETIEQMPNKGRLIITLSNNEVFEGTYINKGEKALGLFITTGTPVFKSSNKSFQGLSIEDVDKYVCNRFSTYDMTKIQIGSVGFNIMSDAKATEYGVVPFRTAATIKAMLESIK